MKWATWNMLKCSPVSIPQWPSSRMLSSSYTAIKVPITNVQISIRQGIYPEAHQHSRRTYLTDAISSLTIQFVGLTSHMLTLRSCGQGTYKWRFNWVALLVAVMYGRRSFVHG